MMKILLLVILFAISPSCLNSQNTGELPVIAYMGVPDAHTNDENFKALSECGFNVSLYPYRNVDRMIAACRVAEKYGVKILGYAPEIESAPTKAASKLKEEKGFYGYFIKDEPDATQIADLQKTISKIKTIDNTHCFYINLQPYTHPGWVPGSMKADTYPEYLQMASRTDCQQISFDHYPVLKSGLRDTWYHNLEMIRKESLRTRKPFWAFALCVPHATPYSDYPAPTMATLRLQIYSNLAYGAQAIQYFTYWTPATNEGFGFHDAPMSNDGKKTKTYALVLAMNKELKTVGKLFFGAKILSVNHIGKQIPVGTTKVKGLPLNISSLKIVSRQGAIVSKLEKDGHLYLCVVNKDFKRSMTLLISPKNNKPQMIDKNLSAKAMVTSYKVEPGDLMLFKLN